MELTAWFSLATICLLGAMTPGPSLAIVLKHTVAGGRLNGLVASIAHGAGIALYAILTVIGMAVIIKETPWLFNIIKYSGAVFLLWLAYKAFTSKSSLGELKHQTATVSLKQSAWEGFMIAFLNPKIAMFFIALFSQFIDANASLQQKVIMVSTVGGIDTVWYCLIALALSKSKVLEKLRNNVHIIEKITGVVLLGITARVLM
ncbi:LysE family translocator [Pseudoalteromonas denitrificans]|uniref:Threonine/homoserine/homoserine lactone efflux protein n=1 Tax=Pseudoalteromonas denitrificans DSM 6059 TaxID=1123010 RepID=A0A1I1MXH5_9GAMM|nr:LysE family translocator [Pseudoalteromonas denitrificans]SFC90154.1 Threonine/homoserine/homoserine lactone efflux protein [Pseudoalteromonas denitrificans DSM 6059]